MKLCETETQSTLLLDWNFDSSDEDLTKNYQKIWEKRIEAYQAFFEKKKAKKTKRK